MQLGRNNDEAYLLNLPVYHSDHGAFVLSTRGEFHKPRRPYRFEAMWLTHLPCVYIVKKAWCNPAIGSCSYRRMRLEHELMEIQSKLNSPSDFDQERPIRTELETLAEQEQVMWL
ncbi:hypothetical protein PTKIN_Ptkin05aG0135300 [Pterospermum kingtungense]